MSEVSTELTVALFVRMHQLFEVRRSGGEVRAREPIVLYHYTNTGALLGILRDEALWASDVRQANDAGEMGYGASLVTAIADGLWESGGLQSKTYLMDWVMRSLGGPKEPTLPPARFAASLTEVDDDLSQWRAYCRPYGGVALGLAADDLLAANDAMAFAAKCVYDRTHQEEIARDLLGIVARHAEAMKDAEEDEVQRAVSVLCDVFAPLLKHPSFSGEREWKVLLEHMAEADRPDHPNEYRSTVDGVSAYVRLKCPQSAIKRVVVGPSPNLAINAASIEQCLRSRGLRDCEVARSAVPHRAW